MNILPYLIIIGAAILAWFVLALFLATVTGLPADAVFLAPVIALWMAVAKLAQIVWSWTPWGAHRNYTEQL